MIFYDLKKKVKINRANNVLVPKTLCWLANKLRSNVVTYEGYYINGFNFATKDWDNSHVTQNSGVRVVAQTL